MKSNKELKFFKGIFQKHQKILNKGVKIQKNTPEFFIEAIKLIQISNWSSTCQKCEHPNNHPKIK
jgi:uncharacterized Zn-finger protein